MDIARLPNLWRTQAADFESLDDRTANVFSRCADDLDLAFHQYAHDGEFQQGCRFCDWEREHNDNYPEPE